MPQTGFPPAAPMYKGIILVGGPGKGTRFRPLSLERPKPLFPVAGLPTIQHHLERLGQVAGLREVLILGFYSQAELGPFLADMGEAYPQLSIRYLEESGWLGTGGGLLRFRQQILGGDPAGLLLINGDVCGDLPLQEMLDWDRKGGGGGSAAVLALVTEAAREQSLNYGSLVLEQPSQRVLHYVEKPKTFISTTINCGVYLLKPAFFELLAEAAELQGRRQSPGGSPEPENPDSVSLERQVFPHIAGSQAFFALKTERWWSQLKSASAAIYANRHCLQLYPKERLAKGPGIVGDVFIHPSAVVEEGAVVGPNVAIGPGAKIRKGARVREAIVLEGAELGPHSLLCHAILDGGSSVGSWARVEGTPAGPNPNMPFAKMEAKPLFRPDGRLNPAISILGSHVRVPPESLLLNCIVLPHKELSGSFKNQIIL